MKTSRFIKFKQNVWLKSYIDKEVDLRNKANNDFEIDFFKLMNNAVFWENRKFEKTQRY